jgi:hypothetical protein
MSVCDHYYGKVFAHLAGGMGITALSAEYSNLGSKLVPGSPITSAFVLLGISIAIIFGMNYILFKIKFVFLYTDLIIFFKEQIHFLYGSYSFTNFNVPQQFNFGMGNPNAFSP